MAEPAASRPSGTKLAEGGEARGARAEASVPSLFRKDRLWLQCAGFVCLAHGLSTRVSVLDQLEALTATAALPIALDKLVSPTLDAAAAAVAIEFQVWHLCAGLALLLAAACWEATRFPRLAAHATAAELTRTLLQMLGDLLLIPFYALARPEATDIRFQDTESNLRILEQCPSLSTFKQTAWLRNANLAFLALLAWDAAGDRYRRLVRRESLPTLDGGVIALDWWEDGPDAARWDKVLLVGSTFTGDALATAAREVCQHFSARGWRCVVMVKRGCGRTMPNAQPRSAATPWCIGGHADFEQAVDHIARVCPGSPICGVGLSTGGGQLRSYLNILGERSKLAAGVVVDAPHSSGALLSMDRRLPFVAKALAIAGHDALQRCGLGPAPAVGDAPPASAPTPEILPGGLVSFVRDELAPRHGYKQTDADALRYLRRCQPADSATCRRPTLELLTLDDQLISLEEAEQLREYWRKSPFVVTAATAQGTHVVRWEGLRPRCWISRVAAEFLEASLSGAAGGEAR